jgi:hypothetical protein
MERTLIFIKHHFEFIWLIIEKLNDILFILLYKNRIDVISQTLLEEFSNQLICFRKLKAGDLIHLEELYKSQNSFDLLYFNPHNFDLLSLNKQFKKDAFLMMGAFKGEKLVGYFFLRFFINKKCFVGRLIDQSYRGKGIGLIMNKIMYKTAWQSGFHCLSTISQKNDSIMRAHSKNSAMKVLKHLPNDYLLVEFINNNI